MDKREANQMLKYLYNILEYVKRGKDMDVR